jgi:hypothetical protein
MLSAYAVLWHKRSLVGSIYFKHIERRNTQHPLHPQTKETKLKGARNERLSYLYFDV